MIQGDGAAYLACWQMGRVEDDKQLRSMARWIDGSSRLWLAAARRFGADEAERVMAMVPVPDPHGEGIAAMTELGNVKVDLKGDQAVVAGFGLVDRMVRIGEQWKIPVRADRGRAAGDVKVYELAGGAYQRYAEAIEGGRFRTLDELLAAMEREFADR